MIHTSFFPNSLQISQLFLMLNTLPVETEIIKAHENNHQYCSISFTPIPKLLYFRHWYFSNLNSTNSWIMPLVLPENLVTYENLVFFHFHLCPIRIFIYPSDIDNHILHFIFVPDQQYNRSISLHPHPSCSQLIFLLH